MCLVEHGQQPHGLDVLGVHLADWSQEDLRPVELLQLKRGHEEFFSKHCKPSILELGGVLFCDLDANLEDNLWMLTLLVVLHVTNQIFNFLNVERVCLIRLKEGVELITL